MILHLLAGYYRRPTNHRQSRGIHLIHSFRNRQLPRPGGTGHRHSPAIAGRLKLIDERRIATHF